MSDLDVLCDRVNNNRVKYGMPKTEFNSGSGLKRQFNKSMSMGLKCCQIFHTMYKSVSVERVIATIESSKFDKNGNTIGD